MHVGQRKKLLEISTGWDGTEDGYLVPVTTNISMGMGREFPIQLLEEKKNSNQLLSMFFFFQYLYV